jgi:hypothetical protein
MKPETPKVNLAVTITREIGGRIPCGCQSTPKAKHLSLEGQPLDNLSSL